MHESDQKRKEALKKAKALSLHGDTAGALALLDALPDGGAGDAQLQLEVAMAQQENLVCLAQAAASIEERLAFFSNAQKAFYRVGYINPNLAQSYQLQAQFWALLGREDMAGRLLETLSHISGNTAVTAQYETATPPVDNALTAAPLYTQQSQTPRLLVLPIKGYDPGMDILYDGLVSVLGKEQVEEYPYKPTLHGQEVEKADGYPTTFRHAGEKRSLEWICEQLKAGYFDAILYADLLRCIPETEIKAILEAAGETPLVIIDGWDDARNHLPPICAFLGLSKSPLCFKREMIQGLDYGATSFPLPLSYPDGRVPILPRRPRTQALFWAGNRYYGLRRLYLSHLEAELGIGLNQKLGPEAYSKALLQCHIGLNLFGFGFDTVRYYEIPAHGALLLSERPPISIPNDFVDGESAVFFDSLPELKSKLADLLQDPHVIPEMAAKGRQHFMKHHSASARARQVLGWMQEKGAL